MNSTMKSRQLWQGFSAPRLVLHPVFPLNYHSACFCLKLASVILPGVSVVLVARKQSKTIFLLLFFSASYWISSVSEMGGVKRTEKKDGGFYCKIEMSSSDNKKPFPCTGKTPASAVDDIKYGFYLSLLKKWKDCAVVKDQKRENIYISQHKCDKSWKKV